MIKKLLNKIKSMFSKKKETTSVASSNCPYKVEQKEIDTVEETKEELLCEHCHKELEGKESAKDETGAMYIWCNRCNYVNKLRDGKIIRKENNGAEVIKAFKLFKEAGHSPSQYSYSKDGAKSSF